LRCLLEQFSIGWLRIAPLPLIAAWWRAGEQHWSDPLHRRHRIADWLVLSDRLIGHSREDVVTLLGEPPPTETLKNGTWFTCSARSEVSFPSTVSGLCCDWMITALFARLALLEIDSLVAIVLSELAGPTSADIRGGTGYRTGYLPLEAKQTAP